MRPKQIRRTVQSGASVGARMVATVTKTRKRKGLTILLGQPKPTAAAHWKKSVRAARLYADQCCREWVKANYPWCVTCGNPDTAILEWAHVLSGKGDAVKWEKVNMCRQCNPCNSLHEFNPAPLTEWFIQTYGQPAFAALVVKSNTPIKFTYSDIMAIGDKYRALLDGAGEGE
jgi:hypothetical protein